MTIYQSDYITVTKKDNLLTQEWSSKPISTDIFKKELLTFLGLFLEHKPHAFLWLFEEFDYVIPKEVSDWVERDLLKTEYVNGMRKIAITISKNKKAHLSLVKMLNSSKSLMQPHYFSDREEAKHYLKTGYDKVDYSTDTINYNIETTTTKHKINLEVAHSDLPQALDALELLKTNKIFAKTHEKQFRSLTAKELEIFKHIVIGYSNKEIAKELFIESSTVSTHRKHIIKKLNTKSFADFYRYAKAFKIVRF